jgi:hypothetical protein
VWRSQYDSEGPVKGASGAHHDFGAADMGLTCADRVPRHSGNGLGDERFTHSRRGVTEVAPPGYWRPGRSTNKPPRQSTQIESIRQCRPPQCRIGEPAGDSISVNLQPFEDVGFGHSLAGPHVVARRVAFGRERRAEPVPGPCGAVLALTVGCGCRSSLLAAVGGVEITPEPPWPVKAAYADEGAAPTSSRRDAAPPGQRRGAIA